MAALKLLYPNIISPQLESVSEQCGISPSRERQQGQKQSKQSLQNLNSFKPTAPSLYICVDLFMGHRPNYVVISSISLLGSIPEASMCSHVWNQFIR